MYNAPLRRSQSGEATNVIRNVPPSTSSGFLECQRIGHHQNIEEGIMNHTHFLMLPKLLLGIALCLSTTAALSTEDPASLQKNAIARIEAVIGHFRKTGNFQSRLYDLKIAEQELLSSQNAFARAGKLSEEAHSLVRLGQIQRMRGQWDAAIEYYKKAEVAAVHGKDTAMQAKALTWMALAEISLPDLGAAGEHSAQAVRLSEELPDSKLRFDTLDIAAQAHSTICVWRSSRQITSAN